MCPLSGRLSSWTASIRSDQSVASLLRGELFRAGSRCSWALELGACLASAQHLQAGCFSLYLQLTILHRGAGVGAKLGWIAAAVPSQGAAASNWVLLCCEQAGALVDSLRKAPLPAVCNCSGAVMTAACQYLPNGDVLSQTCLRPHHCAQQQVGLRLCSDHVQAMAAHNSKGLVICQVERIVDRHTISPRHAHIPGAIVDKARHSAFCTCQHCMNNLTSWYLWSVL